jgi:hypothetical protein
VCFLARGATSYIGTGLTITIVDKIGLLLDFPLPASAPERSGVALAEHTVTLADKIGQVLDPADAPVPTPVLTPDAPVLTPGRTQVITFFESTWIWATLERCLSPCGKLAAGLGSCSEPCTRWGNATAALSGARADIDKGVARFGALTLHGTAGRFRLTFQWSGDAGNSPVLSRDFVVAPRRVQVLGMDSAALPVGARCANPSRHLVRHAACPLSTG